MNPKKEQTQIQELSALYEVARSVSSTLDLQEVAEHAWKEIERLMHPDICLITSYDEEQDAFVFPFFIESGKRYTLAEKVDPTVGFAGWIFRTRQSLFIPDLPQDESRITEMGIKRMRVGDLSRSGRSYIGVPMIAQGRFQGVLSVQSYTPHAFHRDHLEFAETIGDQIGMAIENARLYRNLLRQRNFLQSILDNAPVGIITFDRNGLVTLVNSYHVNTFGRGKIEDYVGRINIGDRQIVGPTIAETCQRLLTAGESFSLGGVKWRTWLTGRDIVINLMGVPLYRDGEAFGGLLLVEDITEKQQIEQHLIQMERLRALGEVATGVVYNFNNLMTVILSNVQLIQMQPYDPASVERSTKTIGRTIHRAAGIVRSIQTFEKIRGTSSAFRPIDLNAIVEEALSMSRPGQENLSETCQQHIEVKTAFGYDTMVNGNASAILEVVTNLVVNALDAMPDGGTLTITTRHRGQGDKATRGDLPLSPSPPPPIGDGPGREEGDWVELAVADTGVGMTEEEQQRCFEPFFTTKRAELGRGLGLSTTYRIVRQHGGDIVVESTPNHGTTFTVRLPAVPGVKDGASIVKDESSLTVPFEGEPRKAKLLIIDDEEHILDILAQVLKDHDIDTASNGHEGIELFRQIKHEVVITDLGMPKLSGVEVAMMVKHLQPSTSVILITGWDVEEEDDILKSEDIDFYIPKPFKLGYVSDVIKLAIELYDQRAQS